MASLALYTTVYPGVEPYLADWFASLRRQTDSDFRLWVGLDMMDPEAACSAMGGDPDAIWIRGEGGDTPGSLRQKALAQIVRHHSEVVLVDSDDIMRPSRVKTARRMLADHDMAGCPLRVVDERGTSLDMIFTLPPAVVADAVFPRTNAFGLSNSAVRTSLLERCLPIPDAAVLVDWFLSTRAWLFGARFSFGERIEMDYRQHGKNTARVQAPFPEQQVVEDTDRVRAHFRLVLESNLEGTLPGRLAELKAAAEDVDLFHERVIRNPTRLSRYVDGLNERATTMLWWAWVAHPSLRHLWTVEEGTV